MAATTAQSTAWTGGDRLDRGGGAPRFERPLMTSEADDRFVGRRVRKPVHRKTVDYSSTIVRLIQTRMYQRDVRDARALQPTAIASLDQLPPVGYPENASTSFATKFVHSSANKVRCSINRVLWTPNGRRLVTGSQSGEFTLWNGQTFNFEMILQAHDNAVRSMIWSHNGNWMMTGDDGGCIKYWQANMNNVKANKTAHKEAVRDLSFSSTDLKFCSCSDDRLVKVWDFARCQEERALTGHLWDVKSVDWHPQKGLLISGGKDNQVKLWDAKTGQQLHELHCHKDTVLQVKWNKNGNWLLTSSRDQLIKLFDLRTLKEIETYKGHRKEVTSIAWHPIHEDLFVSGSYDGSIMHWLVGHETPQAETANAHDSSIWDLGWHPVGHLLCSGSNDHTSKFWCRSRPGDGVLRGDKYGSYQSTGSHQGEQVVGGGGGGVEGGGGGGSGVGNSLDSIDNAIPGVGMAVQAVIEPLQLAAKEQIDGSDEANQTQIGKKRPISATNIAVEVSSSDGTNASVGGVLGQNHSRQRTSMGQITQQFGSTTVNQEPLLQPPPSPLLPRVGPGTLAPLPPGASGVLPPGLGHSQSQLGQTGPGLGLSGPGSRVQQLINGRGQSLVHGIRALMGPVPTLPPPPRGPPPSRPGDHHQVGLFRNLGASMGPRGGHMGRGFRPGLLLDGRSPFVHSMGMPGGPFGARILQRLGPMGSNPIGHVAPFLGGGGEPGLIDPRGRGIGGQAPPSTGPRM